MDYYCGNEKWVGVGGGGGVRGEGGRVEVKMTGVPFPSLDEVGGVTVDG